MNFHIFGDRKEPALLFIHGVLTPWQMWDTQIEHFRKNYCVIVPALDAHEEDRASEFISIEDEARKIEDYICEEFGGEVYGVIGLSMGGVIAHQLWTDRRIKMKKLVMDGAPLAKAPVIAQKIMMNNYLSIIRKSKKRDPKTLENFKKHFLPERHLESYLKIADNMSESSVRNIVRSAFSHQLKTDMPMDVKLYYLHGTKANEMLSVRTAEKIKKHYPLATVYRFSGAPHGELVVNGNHMWMAAVCSAVQRDIKEYEDA